MRLFLCLFIIILVSCKKNNDSISTTNVDQRSFKEIWELYSSQMKLHKKDLNFRFNIPAQKEDLEVLEKVVGLKFTADMLNLYNIGNGQAEDGTELFRGFSLISTAEAAKTWLIMDKQKDSKSPALAVGPAKNQMWNSKWVPIAADAGGNVLCVDFDPADGGSVGQLVAVYLDDVERKVIAPSIRSYFAKTAAGLRSSQLKFDEFGAGPFTPAEIKANKADLD